MRPTQFRNSAPNIEILPHRYDRELVQAAIEEIGWPWSESGDSLLVKPSTDQNAVLISGNSYQFCGQWLRPAYGKIDVETYVDLDTIASVILRNSFSEFGSIAAMKVSKEEKKIILTYRVMIPSEASATVVLEGAFAAYTGAIDLGKNILRIHEHLKNNA